METKLYSAQDKDYHTVYFRITGIVRDSATVQAAIDAYNNADHLRTFEPLENDCRRITISTPAGDDRLAALPT